MEYQVEQCTIATDKEHFEHARIAETCPGTTFTVGNKEHWYLPEASRTIIPISASHIANVDRLEQLQRLQLKETGDAEEVDTDVEEAEGEEGDDSCTAEEGSEEPEAEGTVRPISPIPTNDWVRFELLSEESTDPMKKRMYLTRAKAAKARFLAARAGIDRCAVCPV
jgi:hypothetical protein